MRVGWKQMMTTWEMTLAWLHLSTSRRFAWTLCLEHEKQRVGTKTLSFRTLNCHFLDFHHNVSAKANEMPGTFHDACVQSGADSVTLPRGLRLAAAGVRGSWGGGPGPALVVVTQLLSLTCDCVMADGAVLRRLGRLKAELDAVRLIWANLIFLTTKRSRGEPAGYLSLVAVLENMTNDQSTGICPVTPIDICHMSSLS